MPNLANYETQRGVPLRDVQQGVPPEKNERDKIKALCFSYAHKNTLKPPLIQSALFTHASNLIKENNLQESYLKYCSILLNNALWQESLSAVPYERRLLLLPKCLRTEEHCPAPFDEFGLLCKSCGLCSLEDLQKEAEKLGYAVLIAEGSPLVMQIIETGKIEAIVGVSCLNVLEKVGPYMEMSGIPGVAIPLLQDDCKNTNVDMDWLWDIIHLNHRDQSRHISLYDLKNKIDESFHFEKLATFIPEIKEDTAKASILFSIETGKRWRPLITAGIYMALHQDFEIPFHDDFLKICYAVEIFHKASLIHDDIADESLTRNGKPSLHIKENLPIAINCGDYLIALGYELLESVEASDAVKIKLLKSAIRCHKNLTLGQGLELYAAKNKQILSPSECLSLFKLKTSPAFSAAMAFAAILVKADQSICDQLEDITEILGIAYQIYDDLQDIDQAKDFELQEPNYVISIMLEKEKFLFTPNSMTTGNEFIKNLPNISQKMNRAIQISQTQMEEHKAEIYEKINSLNNPTLQGFLRKIIGKIFGHISIQGWCHESI